MSPDKDDPGIKNLRRDQKWSDGPRLFAVAIKVDSTLDVFMVNARCQSEAVAEAMRLCFLRTMYDLSGSTTMRFSDLYIKATEVID